MLLQFALNEPWFSSFFLNLTIFAKKRWRGGLNSEGTASGCSDSHKVAENKNREAWARRWIGDEKMSSGHFDSP